MVKRRYWIGILIVFVLGSMVITNKYEGSGEDYPAVNEVDIYGEPSIADGGQSFYVAPYGDDAGSGTFDLPWRTIQHATEMLEPGDTVYIRGGVYEEYMELSRGGSYGNYITYLAYPGETPILDGKAVDWDDGFDLAEESYIKIDGLVIRNWNGFGIVSSGQSSHIVVKNVEVHDCDTAIRLFDYHKDWITENAYLHHNSLIGFDCSPGPCTNITMREIRSMYNGVEGDTAADGFAFESGNNILVEDCEASYNGGDGFDFKSDGTHLARVLAHDNGRNNIKLWGEKSSLINALSFDSGLTNLVLEEGGSFRVVNCLFANRRSYGYLATLGGYETSTPTSIVLYNNIFYNDNSAMGGTTLYYPMGAMLTANNNIYWNPYRIDDVICAGFVDGCFSSDDINDGTWSAASGTDSDSAYADPLFVDAGSKDFHLTAESPAVDTGNSDVAPDIDLEGTPRPQGSGVDIGSYERRVMGSSSLGLEDFPLLLMDEAGNLQATFIYGQSEEHGPSHGAWTIDVAGGTLIASILGRGSLYGLPDALMDVKASTFDETHVTGVTASGNLITIGGGDVNLVSRYYEFLEVDGQYAVPVVDIFDGEDWTVGIYSRHSGTSYYRWGSYGKGSQVIDYASAALYMDGDRHVLFVAGITGFTTRAMCRVLSDYQSYDLSGVAVIIQFLDDDGDGTFESIDTMESMPSPLTLDEMALWDLSSGPPLHGANIYQRRVYPEPDGPEFMGSGPVGPPYTQGDFDRLAELGANNVGISHPGLFTETPPYPPDQCIQDDLDELLYMIAKADMFAVISSRTGPGRSEFKFMLDEVGDWFDESHLNDEVWRKKRNPFQDTLIV